MDTKKKILKLIKRSGSVSAGALARRLGLSRQMVHKYLKKLLADGVIGRKGAMPKVEYFLTPKEGRVGESVEIFTRLLTRQNLHKLSRSTFWKLPKEKTIDLHFLLQSSVLFSSKIEGNTLDLNSFLNKAEIPKTKKREVREVEDLQMAYEFAREHTLTEENMLTCHKLLSKTFLSALARGKYRQDKVGVFGSEGLEYMALEAEFVPGEMSTLFAKAAQLLEREMTKKEVFAWSMYLHIMFALVHPFADGNGRIARLFEKWFLAEKLGTGYWYIGSERFYYENLVAYYKALQLGVNYWEVDFKKIQKFIELHV